MVLSLVRCEWQPCAGQGNWMMGGTRENERKTKLGDEKVQRAA